MFLQTNSEVFRVFLGVFWVFRMFWRVPVLLEILHAGKVVLKRGNTNQEPMKLTVP